MTDRYTVPYPPHGSAEWHRARWADDDGNRRTAASEAAAMFDAHRFIEAGDLAARQLADQPPDEGRPTEAQARGHELEDVLAEWWGRQNDMVARKPRHLFVCGRAIATIDRELYPDRRSRKPVPDRHLEVKTTNDYFDPNAPLPDHWFWQGIAQAYCRGSRIVEWVIIDARLRFHTYTQTITDEALETFDKRLAWWMSWIDMGLVPEGVTLNYEQYATWHAVVDPGQVLVLKYEDPLAVEVETLRAEYKACGQEIKATEERQDAIKARIAGILEDREAVYVADPIGFDVKTAKPLVTWKPGKRTTINKAQLAEDGLLEKYEIVSHPRTMLFKDREKETTDE